MRGSIGTANSRREISASGFVIGRDSRGRWTALGAGGLSGGLFKSKDAAIRYAQSEAGRSPGAVRLTAAPLDLPFDKGRIGHGEGLPTWWRLGPGTRGMTSFADRLPVGAGLDRRWFMIDLGIVAGLAVLCLAVAAVLS
ncbi:hypothetical protein SAMN05519103_07233 [Rhizobiales bacterium GAS113]|nr:hypothetical protein SAMN05519103_07233 [Rhizobiales bacterium GAS113]